MDLEHFICAICAKWNAIKPIFHIMNYIHTSVSGYLEIKLALFEWCNSQALNIDRQIKTSPVTGSCIDCTVELDGVSIFIQTRY